MVELARPADLVEQLVIIHHHFDDHHRIHDYHDYHWSNSQGRQIIIVQLFKLPLIVQLEK